MGDEEEEEEAAGPWMTSQRALGDLGRSDLLLFGTRNPISGFTVIQRGQVEVIAISPTPKLNN